MKNIILILLFAFTAQLYAQNPSKYGFKPQYSIALPSDNGDKMMNQCSRDIPKKNREVF